MHERGERGQVIHFAEFQKFKRLTRSVSQNSLKTGILQYESPDPFHAAIVEGGFFQLEDGGVVLEDVHADLAAL